LNKNSSWEKQNYTFY